MQHETGVHVVVGAGPIGSGIARLLAEQGQQAKVFSEDFVMDSRQAQAEFGCEPTGWDSVLADVLRSFGPAGRPS